MNKVFIVGNLTRDPELRTVRDGISVCSFTVAVNRRIRNAEAGQPEADFFRVTAWRGLGENCSRYLAKGRKVAVTGSVSVSTYTGNDGTTRATLEVTADDVEFLSPRGEGGEVPATPRPQAAPVAPQSNGFVQVDDDELPF
ncbi:MAG: single-stranded DNA-binding protein [Clostridia bacterium]|jgi:single-strand DNA-binding protein|nr:single-stranded DNA-binding protein [Clostridia bacterium]MBR6299765.1 single-stranded DNA-binding protein [Clostridia bacterium]